VIRRYILFATLLVLGVVALPQLRRVAAADPATNIKLDVSNAGPREFEEQTQKSIVRDYGRAWATMQDALERNNSAVLDRYFAGVAKDKLSDAVAEQQKSGVRVRYVDRSHALHALFYSPEGSAIEVRDTAQIEMQVLDGDKVVHSEQLTQPYLVLFTPAEDRWKVRLLEPLPQ
jgi:hypothetical protein